MPRSQASSFLKIYAAVFLASFVWQTRALGQAPKTRPSVGLVFEGGGALGFAHVGVLEWMEQHRIPVDYVAGTSMGGLVGGLYAAGKSPAEIRELVDSIDWGRVLSGENPFQTLSFRRKEDRLAYPNRLEFGLRKGITAPSGLNSGYEVNLLFDRVLLPYYDLKSFDDLPIAFRCVATALKSGKQKVFDQGSLQQALRATMSIPGVFAPVAIGDEIYADGAAVNNLPVDVARAMGADIVIAVYLDTGSVTAKSFGSLLDVVGRNIGIMVAANEQASMKNADILLSAQLKEFSAMDFGKSTAILPRGVEAAEQKSAELGRLALSESDWKQHLANRKARRRTEVPVPKFLIVEGRASAYREQIEAVLEDNIGRELDIEELERNIASLQGTGIFSSIEYGITERNGQSGLLIRPTEKPYAPPFLNLGVNVEGSDFNDIRLGVSGRITFFGLAGAGSELRTDISFGQLAGITTELFRPIVAGSKFFVAPRATATERNFDVYDDGGKTSQYKLDNRGLGIDFGYSFSGRAQLRIGQGVTWLGVKRNIGENFGPNFSIRSGVTSASFQYYGQDDALLPRKGAMIQASFNRYSVRPDAEGGFQQAELSAAQFFQVSERGSVFGTFSAGTSFNATGLGVAGFSIGGPVRLSAYGRNELLGNRYALLQAGYLHRILRLNPILGDAVYAASFLEIGKIRSIFPVPDLPRDIAFGLITKTFIGPITVGAAIGDNSHRKWWFGIGRVF